MFWVALVGVSWDVPEGLLLTASSCSVTWSAELRVSDIILVRAASGIAIALAEQVFWPHITGSSPGGSICHQTISWAAVHSRVARAVVIGLVAVAWAAADARIALAKAVIQAGVSQRRLVLDSGELVIAAVLG